MNRELQSDQDLSLTVNVDELVLRNLETALTENPLNLSDEQKIEQIAYHFRQIMETLGLDLSDDSLSGTPKRVAKMYVQEIFKGLNEQNKPEPTLFENRYAYDKMLVERNIAVYSNCEHHFVPIVGKAHVAYISSGKVIGLSKLNRIVDHYARRPQVQERLTMEIATELKEVLQTEDVAVIIDATHHCVSSRGIRDTGSTTVTTEFSGKFLDTDTRKELMQLIGL